MNAKNSFRPEYKTQNSESYRQPLFDITGDEEPIKPRSSCNIDEKEMMDQDNYLNVYKLDKKANSDKVFLDGLGIGIYLMLQDPYQANENKARQKQGKQSFRVKKESEKFMQNFFLSESSQTNDHNPFVPEKKKKSLNKQGSSKVFY